MDALNITPFLTLVLLHLGLDAKTVLVLDLSISHQPPSNHKPMYRRPKFLEVLIQIREEMAREADYDTDLFAEMVRSGRKSEKKVSHSLADVQPADEKKAGRAKRRS